MHRLKVGTVDGRGHDGHLNYTICDACRPRMPLDSEHTEASFFAKFDIVVLTTRSGA